MKRLASTQGDADSLESWLRGEPDPHATLSGQPATGSPE